MLHYICGMPSTREIPSNAEIEALAAKIRVLRSKQARTTFQTLLSLISSSAGDSPIELLSKWLSQTELTENIVKVFRPILLFKPPFVIETCTDNCNMKINASETTVPQITEVFDLKFDKGKKWALAENSLVGVPSMLSMS
jgi:hypothetical protein